MRAGILFLGLFAGALATVAPAVAAPILDRAQWDALMAGADQPFSPDGVSYQRIDLAGLQMFPPLSLAPAAITGQFGCVSFQFPCGGAYAYTLTLPVAVTGFAAQVHAAQGTPFGHELDLWGATVAMSRHGESFSFDGFVGTLFAPTNQITFLWPGGLLSTDDSVLFQFSDVRVMTAVAEPATAVLLLAGLAGLAVGRRARRPGG